MSNTLISKVNLGRRSVEQETAVSELIREVRTHVVPRMNLMSRIRRALDMTQVETATLLDVTQGAISKQEKGRVQGLSAIAFMARSKGARVILELELADGSRVDLSDAVDLVDPALDLSIPGLMRASDIVMENDDEA